MPDIIVYGNGSRLPNAYQEVSYLESDGTQYIDSGVQSNFNNFKIKIAAKLTSVQNGSFFGIQETNNQNNELFLRVNTDNNFVLYGGYNNAWLTTSIPYTLSKHNIEAYFDNNLFYLDVDGTKNTVNRSATYDSTRTIPLFCEIRTNKEDDGGRQQYISSKIYYYEMYTNDSLVRNFIPCYRKSDSVAGMWDLANNLGCNMIAGGYYNYAGTLIHSNDYSYDDVYHPVTAGHQLKVTGAGDSSTTDARWIEYDENKVVVDYWNTYNRPTPITLNSRTTYIRISVQAQYQDTITITDISDNKVIYKTPFYTNQGTGSFTVGPDTTSGYRTKEVASKMLIQHLGGGNYDVNSVENTDGTQNLVINTHESGLGLDRTVKFKVNDEVKQIISVMAGDSINRPNIASATLRSWKDINDNIIVFPYTPTGDISLYNANTLPAIYQEVEYLESTGTQYIDTGIVPTSMTKTYIDYSILSFVGSGTCIGAHSGTDYAINNYYPITQKGSSQTLFRSVLGSSSTQYEWESLLTNRHQILFNDNLKMYLDGNLVKTWNEFTEVPTDPIYLFWASGLPEGQYISPAKIYSCNIWQDGSILSREMIPCYRKVDSKPGMYDLVNDVFYTNAATSGDDFVVGPDV